MASISKINGRYRCQIRRAGHKTISKYFDTEREATTWGRQIEAAIDVGQVAPVGDKATVKYIIREYRRIKLEFGQPVRPESSQNYVLNHLSDDLGDVAVPDLTPDRLVRWAKMRKELGAGPYTINMELSLLGTVIRHTASFLRLTFPDVIGNARPMLFYLQLIGSGNKRTRLANEDEFSRLIDAAEKVDPRIADAYRVAAITGLRRGEIARIVWEDLDQKAKAIMVRKRKHPRAIEAKDELVPLLGESWEIVLRQPKTSERIFPISREKLTDTFTESCRALGIPNLHLHDLRRNAASALREMGFDDYERKKITGHRSDKVHERYIAVDIESLHQKYDSVKKI